MLENLKCFGCVCTLVTVLCLSHTANAAWWTSMGEEASVAARIARDGVEGLKAPMERPAVSGIFNDEHPVDRTLGLLDRSVPQSHQFIVPNNSFKSKICEGMGCGIGSSGLVGITGLGGTGALCYKTDCVDQFEDFLQRRKLLRMSRE